MIHPRWKTPTARRSLLSAILVLALGALAGCGSMVEPVTRFATATLAAAEMEIAQATATTPPTATPLPPTSTPLPEPTVPPTLAPTATPEPTKAPAQSPIDRLVAVRDPETGAELFNLFQDAANYACANCHLADSEKTNLGPGLLNIKERAATRIEGMTAAEYIYQSIVDSKAYTVEGFDPEPHAAELGGHLQRFADIRYRRLSDDA